MKIMNNILVRLAGLFLLVLCGGLLSCNRLTTTDPGLDFVCPTPDCPPPAEPRQAPVWLQPACPPGTSSPSAPAAAPGTEAPGSATGPLTPSSVPTAAPNCPALAPRVSATTVPGKVVRITVPQAVVTAIQNNQAFAVQRFNPQLRRTVEEQQIAAFDPVIDSEVSYSGNRTFSPGVGLGLGLGPILFPPVGVRTEQHVLAGTLSVTKSYPTGTTVALGGSTSMETSPGQQNAFITSRLGMSVTQALLRGAGSEVNLVSLHQAQIDTRISQYELRGLAETLVAQVAQAYYNYALAQRQIEIVSESLKLAEQQLNDTLERIKVGKLAEIERAASEAEIAQRQVALINARSELATSRLALLRLLNPNATDPDFWHQEIVLSNEPFIPSVILDDVQAHVNVALRMRPELNQARLLIKRGDLDLVRTKNGLLPVMDLFVTLGQSGYATSFGRSMTTMGNHKTNGYDVLAGVASQYPIGNRDARAQYNRAIWTRQQAVEALGNTAQLVELDVRTAYIEVNRTAEQIVATAATRRLREETLRAETEKFRVGRSTSLLVAATQRDLLQSQIDEVQSVVSHLVALIELHRLDGSLLERACVTAPGREPVELPASYGM